MPRVSEAYLALRRDEILDGAQRAFARYGYDGATVARLEEETGLSRGAIFHHFADKLDLFVALATRDSRRMAQLIRGRGPIDAMRQVVAEDPDWLRAYLSIATRYRTDDDFRRRWEQRGEPLEEALRDSLQRERRAGRVRADVHADVLVRLVGIIIDGLVLQRAVIGDIDHVQEAIDLIGDLLRPRHGA